MTSAPSAKTDSIVYFSRTSQVQAFITSGCQRQIEKIARKQTRGTRIEWEDAAQTARIKILEAVKAGRFCRGGPAEFNRWAFTVARFEIIDLVRRETQRNCMSLDRPVPGTDFSFLDTLSDPLDLGDAVERADLTLNAIQAIHTLDCRHPHRCYLALWQGRLKGQNQSQLAVSLGVSQGAVSKRWKELLQQVAEALGITQINKVQSAIQVQDRRQRRQSPATRARADRQW